MIEMVATVSLLGILLAMAVGALSNYFANKSLETSARELTSQIREAQAMAVATGNTYRLDFTGTDRKTYSLQRRQGESFITVRGPMTLESSVEFAEGTPPSFGGDSYMDFFARGTTEGGQLILTQRFGKTRTVAVDAETVNVRVN